MKKILTLCLILFFTSMNVFAEPMIGSTAPDFKGRDTSGKMHQLSDYKGRLVVLEWFNHSCPFVKKHYGAGHMQKLQKEYTGKDVVWLSVNSSSKDSGVYTTPEEANKLSEEKGSAASAVILDPLGEIGKLYQAKTTPHMFVIDKEGILRYMGAIDSDSSANPARIMDAENYVAAALDALLAGKEVQTKSTKAYGCSVKY